MEQVEPFIFVLLIGVGDNIGKTSRRAHFHYLCYASWNYFKGDCSNLNFLIQMNTTGQLHGTGAAKAGGTMLLGPLPGKLATTTPFLRCYLPDPSTHTKIEEVGSANFFLESRQIMNLLRRWVHPSCHLLPSTFTLLGAEHRLGDTSISWVMQSIIWIVL